MIWHVVMWTLHDTADGPRFRDALLECRSLVAGTRHYEVGLRDAELNGSVDLCLVAAFDDAATLQSYIKHPVHKSISRCLAPLRRERHVLDFACP